MELRQLKYFATVADTLNFSEASRKLYITQSTLSQQIKQLEAELNSTLFIRSSHSVSLTEAGRELLPLALRTLHNAEACMTHIKELNDLKCGTLDIGVTHTFSPILTETLLTFMKQYPMVKLNIYYRPMAELTEMLMHHDIDFMLAFRPTSLSPQVETHILFQSCLAAIVNENHPLSSHERVAFDELLRYDIALPSKGLQARNALEEIAASFIPRMRVRIEMNEVNILLKMVRDTQLVTILSEATIHNISGVKAIPIDAEHARMSGCVHILKDTYRKRSMVEFINMLAGSIAVRERQTAWLNL